MKLLVLFAIVLSCRAADPPPHGNLIASARYLINNANWGIIGSISTLKGNVGRAFTNIVSIADGPIDNGSGIPYMYINVQDQTFKDHLVNPNVSLSVSAASYGYCAKMGWDSEDPRCARLTLCGQMEVLKGDEEAAAQKFMFARHPGMKMWHIAHEFHILKINIDYVWFLDFFGYANVLDVTSYLKGANVTSHDSTRNVVNVV